MLLPAPTAEHAGTNPIVVLLAVIKTMPGINPKSNFRSGKGMPNQFCALSLSLSLTLITDSYVTV